MNCQICLERINQELDGGPPADVHEHLRACPDCRVLYQAARQLRLSLCRISSPPIDLSDSIVRRVLADSLARRRRHRRLLVSSLALAAAVLIVVGIALSWPASVRRRPDQPSPLVEGLHVPSPVQATFTLRESVAEASSAVVALTSRTVDETVGQSRLLVPVVTGPIMDDLEAATALETTAVTLRETGQGLNAGLQPVAQSARRALGLLLRDMLPTDAAAKPDL